MLTVARGTHSYEFIRYIEPRIGKVSYYTWPGGIIPAGEGAWAKNAPMPPASKIDTMFCAAAPNIALRLAGKRIPIAQHQSELWDGGIGAYFGTPVAPEIGAGYFAGYMEPFNLQRALHIARETRQIVLAGWKYEGVALALQGHVFMIFPSGWILESVPGLGLRWVRAEGSYAAAHATIMIHPRNWLEYHGDRVHKGGVRG